jgi:hypothetical protein
VICKGSGDYISPWSVGNDLGTAAAQVVYALVPAEWEHIYIFNWLCAHAARLSNDEGEPARVLRSSD